MNMQEALEWAADYCDRNRIFVPPKNERGYDVSGWKPPTPEERVQVIATLAGTAISQPSQQSVLSDEKVHEVVADLIYVLDAAYTAAGDYFTGPEEKKTKQAIKRIREALLNGKTNL